MSDYTLNKADPIKIIIIIVSDHVEYIENINQSDSDRRYQ